jgi:transposase
VQYGIGVKVNAVYMSQCQMLPYNRIEDHFQEQMGIPLSSGSIVNFNRDAFDRLSFFEVWGQKALRQEGLLHVDETGINVSGKRCWLHNVSSPRLSHFAPHAKRGGEAMEAIGILPGFTGILCHDHWKPYFHYGRLHALCNAHHLRELERAWEQDGQQWAQQLSVLLKEANQAVHDADGCLDAATAEQYRVRGIENFCSKPSWNVRHRSRNPKTENGDERPNQNPETYWSDCRPLKTMFSASWMIHWCPSPITRRKTTCG